MMKVSSRVTYAIRALVHLARSANGATLSLAKIAESQAIPLPFLEQIFSKLRKDGLVEAVRGPQGGYKLSKDATAITLAQVVQSLDGPMEPVLCTMPENRSPNCHHDDGGCMSHAICNELDGALNKILSDKTLAVLALEADRPGVTIPIRAKA